MATQRKAIIVGGAGGIGSAVCTKLAEEGYRVVVVDLNGALAASLTASLPGSGHSHHQMDVTDETQVELTFDSIENDGAADALVVIAGQSLSSNRIENFSMSEWNATMALNITGTFLCVRKFAQLRQRSPVEHGRIVSFSSFAGQSGASPTGVAYSAAKAGVIGLTRHVAVELASSGVTVNVIAPGAVATEAMVRHQGDEGMNMLKTIIPMRRLCAPREIAVGVAFLVSEEASYVTGMTLDMNGGALMR